MKQLRFAKLLAGLVLPVILVVASSCFRVLVNPSAQLYLDNFEEVPGLDLKYLHPIAPNARIGNSVYLISGTIDSRSVFTLAIERTSILASGSITPWKVAGEVRTSKDQSCAVADSPNIYIIGGHPSKPDVTRIRISGETIFPEIDEKPLLTGRYGAAAVVYGDYLYVMGGGNLEKKPSYLSSVERAKIREDGSLVEWETYADLTSGRIQPGLAVTTKYVWLFGGQAGSGQSIERAQLLESGRLGKWEDVGVIPSMSGISVEQVGRNLFFTGGSDLGSQHVYSILLDDQERPQKIIDQGILHNAPRVRAALFASNTYLYIAGGAGGNGKGMNGWRVTERAKLNSR